MQSLTVGDASGFFDWRLDLTEGEEGRKLRGTKDAASLRTYKKQFSLLYRRRTGKDMDSQLSGQIRKVRPNVSVLRRS